MKRSARARRALSLGSLGLTLFVVSLPAVRWARADPPDASASMGLLSCEPASRPGRVLCQARVYVAEGDEIAWGDVVLLDVPPFASALRGRIGPHDATTRLPRTWLWEFALVARGAGSGEVTARARLVVCREKACLPREVPLVGRVVAGASADAGP
jgi:hypothetical protein